MSVLQYTDINSETTSEGGDTLLNNEFKTHIRNQKRDHKKKNHGHSNYTYYKKQ